MTMTNAYNILFAFLTSAIESDVIFNQKVIATQLIDKRQI